MAAGNANQGVTRISSIPYVRFNAMRAEVVESLRGRVLEIGAGRGANFDSFAQGVDWTGLEPRRKTRAQLAIRAAQYGHVREPLAAEAEAIPLPDDSIDVVLGTYVFCSITDPERVLAEVRRVLVPGGRLVLVEHVVSHSSAVSRLQRAASPLSAAVSHGCRWDRDPVRDAEHAGFQTVAAGRHRVGTGIPGLAVPCVIYQALSDSAEV